MQQSKEQPDLMEPVASELTDRQQVVLETVEQYYAVTGEPCPVRYLARRLRVHHSTIQSHLEALERKGWLQTTGPAIPRRRLIP